MLSSAGVASARKAAFSAVQRRLVSKDLSAAEGILPPSLAGFRLGMRLPLKQTDCRPSDGFTEKYASSRRRCRGRGRADGILGQILLV